MKCGTMPPGYLHSVMHQLLKSKTATSYDNVIATSPFYDDEEEVPEPVCIPNVIFAFAHVQPSMCVTELRRTLMKPSEKARYMVSNFGSTFAISTAFWSKTST